jgi:NAD(P)-dependent dehydrogenase (short-subunit alcohol dehydrogenase family)
MLDTNLTGPFLMIKHAVPYMISAGGGSIINVASIAGLLGLPNMVAYCTTKAGMLGLSRQVAFDYGIHKIRCNTVLPGAFRSEMFQAGMTDFAKTLGLELEDVLKVWSGPAPLRRIAKCQEIAGLFVYLASDEATYTTAAEFVCDAGLHTVDAAAIAVDNLVKKVMAERAAAAEKK